MKISPLSQGTGTPSAQVGDVTTSRTSPDRLAAAKAIASGQERPPATDSQVDRIQQNVRRIKMKTQVSPDREILPAINEDNIAADPGLTTETQGPISHSTEETTEVTEETKPLSPQFAALAKQKRALQVKERELLEREKALASRTTTDGVPDFMSRLKSEPLSVLDEAGALDSPEFYNALTERIMNGNNPQAAEIKRLQAKLEALETGFDTKLTDRDNQAKQQALGEMRKEANVLVKADDAYKYTRAMGKTEEAVKLIEAVYDKDGEILDVSEALRLIEAECKKDYEAYSKVLTPTPQSTQPQRQQDTGIKTLTNRDGARPQLDRRARALAAFHGTKR